MNAQGNTPVFSVKRTKPFVLLCEDYGKQHDGLAEDLRWLEGRLKINPRVMGDKVPGLKGLNLPVYKARCKDSCCQLGAPAGWRIYYAVSEQSSTVYLLFFHHKKELANPATGYLQQKLERAFQAGV